MSWGVAFNDFLDRLGNMEESKREKETKEAILGLKSLIRGNRMGSNSAGNPKIPGPLTDRITKMLIYGKQGKSDTDLGIGNKQSFKRFRQTSKKQKSMGGRNIKKDGEKFEKNWRN